MVSGWTFSFRVAARYNNLFKQTTYENFRTQSEYNRNTFFMACDEYIRLLFIEKQSHPFEEALFCYHRFANSTYIRKMSKFMVTSTCCLATSNPYKSFKMPYVVCEEDRHRSSKPFHAVRYVSHPVSSSKRLYSAHIFTSTYLLVFQDNLWILRRVFSTNREESEKRVMWSWPKKKKREKGVTPLHIVDTTSI